MVSIPYGRSVSMWRLDGYDCADGQWEGEGVNWQRKAMGMLLAERKWYRKIAQRNASGDAS